MTNRLSILLALHLICALTALSQVLTLSSGLDTVGRGSSQNEILRRTFNANFLKFQQGALDINIDSIYARRIVANLAGSTGITGATGGVANTGSTTIGADTDEDGNGSAAIQTKNQTRVEISNAGNATFSGAISYDVADTTALKAVSTDNTIGMMVYLKELSSGLGVGGGAFMLVDSASYCSANAGNRVWSWPSDVNAKRWVRAEWLEKPGTVDATWAGASDKDATDDHSELERSLGAVPAGGTWIVPRTGSGVYLMGRNAADQISLTLPDNVLMKVLGTIQLKNSITVPSNTTRLFNLAGGDNLTIDGEGVGYLDGNIQNQSGWTFGDHTKGGIFVRRTGSDSLRNVTIKNIRLRRWTGTALWVSDGERVTVTGCDIDSCAEGVVVSTSRHVKLKDNRIGLMLSQDGIEPSTCYDVEVSGNQFYGEPGTDNHSIDLFHSDHVIVTNNNILASSRAVSLFGTRDVTFGPDNFLQTLGAGITGDDTLISVTGNTFINSMTSDYAVPVLSYDTQRSGRQEWTVSNNTIISDLGIQFQGSGDGIFIKHNILKPFTAAGTYVGTGILVNNYSTSYPYHLVIRGNDLYRFNIGIYLATTVLDSAIIDETNFKGVNPDQRLYNPNGIVFSSQSTIALNSPGLDTRLWGTIETAYGSATVSGDSILQITAGVSHRTFYDVAASIDSISESGTYFPPNAVIVIFSANANTKAVRSAHNISLNGGLPFIYRTNAVLVLKKNNNSKWVEISRSTGDASSYESTALLAEQAGTPDTPADGSQVRTYMKGDKFIIQYNHGGTVKYRYIDLTSTDATWTYTTSAP